MNEIGRPVDVGKRLRLAPRPLELRESPAGLVENAIGSPGDVGEQRRIEAAKADEHVAAVEGRNENRVRPGREPRRHLAEPFRPERRAVAPGEQGERPAFEDLLHRGAHARAEITAPLVAETNGKAVGELPERGVAGIGSAP